MLDALLIICGVVAGLIMLRKRRGPVPPPPPSQPPLRVRTRVVKAVALILGVVYLTWRWVN